MVNWEVRRTLRNLKKMLRMSGITYQEIAEHCGISENALKQKFAGRAAFRLIEIEAMLEYMRCSADMLWYDDITREHIRTAQVDRCEVLGKYPTLAHRFVEMLRGANIDVGSVEEVFEFVAHKMKDNKAPQ